jgi:putative transposase
MEEAKAEVLAFNACLRAHWRKIWSTNPLERLNKQLPVLDWSIRRPATAVV